MVACSASLRLANGSATLRALKLRAFCLPFRCSYTSPQHPPRLARLEALVRASVELFGLRSSPALQRGPRVLLRLQILIRVANSTVFTAAPLLPLGSRTSEFGQFDRCSAAAHHSSLQLPWTCMRYSCSRVPSHLRAEPLLVLLLRE